MGDKMGDKIKVVRCKDCKFKEHLEVIHCSGLWCNLHAIWVNKKDYCSWGEVVEEVEED